MSPGLRVLHGIADHKALALLMDAGGQATPGELARPAGISTAGVTGIIDRLEAGRSRAATATP